jgi:hypothetical protein
MASIDNNYTLGKGEIYFAPFVPGTTTPNGERYLGNTPEFNITFESEDLEHFSSDRGIRELDKSVILQITRSGSLITDNIEPKNVALFFFGSTDALTVTQTTVTNEPVGIADIGVELGMFYQLGMTTNNPSGARKIIYPGASGTLFTLKKGVTTLVSGTDYLLNTDLGRIEILATSPTVEDGDELTCTYTVAASTRTRIISGSAPVEGALRFIAYNPVGDNIDYYLPSVALSPNGDYALKSDEWQQIPFNVKVLKPGTGEAVYADGRAVIDA